MWPMQAWIPVVSSSLFFWKRWGFYIKLKVSWLLACLWCMSQTIRDWNNGRRVQTHEKNSGETPIGHNNTKHFLCPIRSRHVLEFLETVLWELEPRGSFTPTWKRSSHPFSRPDWLPLGLRGWPMLCHHVHVHLYRWSLQSRNLV